MGEGSLGALEAHTSAALRSDSERLLAVAWSVAALVGLLLLQGVPVDADDGAFVVVDLEGDPVGGALDLGLLEALLDGGHRSSAVLDGGDEFDGSGLDVDSWQLPWLSSPFEQLTVKFPFDN